MWQLFVTGAALLCVVRADVAVDSGGYILYCPCMGRFGNQADHFLGVLAFAKALDRTLVLPPWVEYQPGKPKSVQVPFSTYFDVAPLERYLRVLTMDVFMDQVAPELWPSGNRTVLCYMERHNSTGCNAKDGNPFGPFWDTFDVEFTASHFYGPLTYDVHHGDHAARWRREYTPEHWPVLAFTGAPASFPVQRENAALQEHLHWSPAVNAAAAAIVAGFPRGPFIAIHLRNGPDWERACVHVPQSPNLFSAAQCLGSLNEHGRATAQLCLPSDDTIVRQLKRVVRAVHATTVFVASDHDHMIQPLTRALVKMKVSVVHSHGAGPHVDLAVMGRANHLIANCISSFSAFAKRERDVHGLPTSFWAFPVMQKHREEDDVMHDEF